ncbi:unnamed protein product [Didymodactylos carnosus]|uniref:RBR-type E3 ubiquitin transferase n=1 Tax=Didymodactylos carnosus TaxID=1234261 RepID=A0A815F9Y0_9BILA|nr:unnamed protein product [Didymodactylos carnosus]CAF1326303.1 unnamed protein product [Didymodactylos carnosus]CAF3926291.1 unnamed protein product [Didymodactylos carnosus]CAF4176260.1 unnamed protein product [Didymodactylos carnosus]
MSDIINCPEKQCNGILEYQAIKDLLTKNNQIELFERYDYYCLHVSLYQQPEFTWCAHSCGSGQLNNDGEKYPIMTCIKCEKKTCFHHRLEWHTGYTCKEYDKLIGEDEKANQKWIVANSKKCPNSNCRYHIQKNDGCDHITCKCGYEFCWICMANYNQIRRDGNHRHNKYCRHYAKRIHSCTIC